MTRDRNVDLTVQTYSVDLDDVCNQSPSVAVVQSVAALTNREPETLDPLVESVDPDALDTLLRQSAESASECQIQFRYHGYHVEATGDREIRLTPVDELQREGK